MIMNGVYNMNENDLFVCGIYPSGGIYKWPFDIKPNHVFGTCKSDEIKCKWIEPFLEKIDDNINCTAQTVYECEVEKYYTELEQYRTVLYEVVSIDKFNLSVGTIYDIPSPIACKRDIHTFLSIIDHYLKIDGKIYKIKGLETHMPNTDIKVGEIIGVLV